MASNNPDNSGSRNFFRGAPQKRRNRGRPPHSNPNSRRNEYFDGATASNWERPHSSVEYGNGGLNHEERNAVPPSSHSYNREPGQENPIYLSNLSYITPREYFPSSSLGQYQPHAENIEVIHGDNAAQAFPKSASSRGARRASGKPRYQRGGSSGYQQHQGYRNESYTSNNLTRTSETENLRTNFAENLHLSNGEEHVNSNQGSALTNKSQRGGNHARRRGENPERRRGNFQNYDSYQGRRRNSPVRESFGNQSSETSSANNHQYHYQGNDTQRQQNRASNGVYSSQDNRRQRDRPVSSNSNSNQSSYKNNVRSRFKEYEHKNWRSEGSETRNNIEANDATQRERLTSQLTSGVYECMVCCESVQPAQSIWNCTQCFHVFHLACVRRWAQSSKDGKAFLSYLHVMYISPF